MGIFRTNTEGGIKKDWWNLEIHKVYPVKLIKLELCIKRRKKLSYRCRKAKCIHNTPNVLTILQKLILNKNNIRELWKSINKLFESIRNFKERIVYFIVGVLLI